MPTQDGYGGKRVESLSIPAMPSPESRDQD
jgi:hypothetical protein